MAVWHVKRSHCQENQTVALWHTFEQAFFLGKKLNVDANGRPFAFAANGFGC